MILTSFSLSCHPHKAEDEKKIDQDSLDRVNEEAGMARQRKREAEFKENMQKKGYRFVCTKECNGNALFTIEGVVEDEGLHIETTVSEDSLFIDLRFLEACCQEFSGDVEKSGDTLKLTYSPMGEMRCRCTCEYKYRFALPAQKYKSKYLQVNGQLVSINSTGTKRKSEK